VEQINTFYKRGAKVKTIAKAVASSSRARLDKNVSDPEEKKAGKVKEVKSALLVEKRKQGGISDDEGGAGQENEEILQCKPPAKRPKTSIMSY
jgi:hypothetical protein